MSPPPAFYRNRPLLGSDKHVALLPLGLAEHNPPLFQSQRSSIRFPLKKMSFSAG